MIQEVKMSSDRREFLRTAGLLATAGTLLDLARSGPALAQIPEPVPEEKDKEREPSDKEKQEAAAGEWIAVLGKIKDLNEKEPVLVKADFLDSLETAQETEKLFVRWEKINADTGRWIVLSAKCTHLKCTIEHSPGNNRFVCPCHGSEYSLSGEVLKRPSRKDLPDYSELVYEEDGKLKLKRNVK
jgi:Rieske Fe-S protein